MIKISPSVLACDFTQLGNEVLAMQKAGAEMIHLDVMDGHFVPNITFGAPVIASLKKNTNIFFDTHLMISDPLKYTTDFVSAGSDRITFHVESYSDTAKTIDNILEHGIEAGLSVKPSTDITVIYPYLSKLSQVLIMTVEPGFGGQSFIQDMLDKILALKKHQQENGLNFDIQVDGGIDTTTAPLVCAHGANVLVAGSSLFKADDYFSALSQLRSAGIQGLNRKLF